MNSFGIDASLDISVTAALSQLPPSTQNLLSQAQQTFSDIGPLVGIAAQIAGGHSIDASQIMAGLTTVASMVNPLVGAAMGAVGGLVTGINEGMQGLFRGLGWVDPPTRTYVYTGYQRTGIDPIPYGVKDPKWLHINSVNDLKAIKSGNIPGQAKRPAVNPAPPWNVIADETLSFLLNGMRTAGYDKNIPIHGVITQLFGIPLPAAILAQMGAAMGLDDFEKFFYPLYAKNLELWANGVGFVPPRELLAQAANAWNATHGAEVTKAYPPADRFSAPTPSGRSPNFIQQSVVSTTIGTGGDFADGSVGNISQMPPWDPRGWVVNMGAFNSNVPPKRVVNLHFGAAPAALPLKATVLHLGGAPAVVSPVVHGAPSPPQSRVVLAPLSIVSRWLPYAPAAAGAALFPVWGVAAPAVGAAASALWVLLRKK